jgi:hypothetical protein
MAAQVGNAIALADTCIAVPSRKMGKYDDNSWQGFSVF